MKTTKVYHAPGYPLDPKKEQKRAFEGLPEFSCRMIPRKPFKLQSQTVEMTFGSMAEAEAFLSARFGSVKAILERERDKS